MLMLGLIIVAICVGFMFGKLVGWLVLGVGLIVFGLINVALMGRK